MTGVGDRLGVHVGDEVAEEVGDEVGDIVEDQAGVQVADQVGLALGTGLGTGSEEFLMTPSAACFRGGGITWSSERMQGGRIVFQS